MPLWILHGNLIGIDTAIVSRTGGSLGIGFAITTTVAKQIMEQIIQTGGVTRGWIGVEVQDLTPELAESFKRPNTNGALIAGVLKGGPADRAGVKPGDILIAVDSQPVIDSSTMLNLIAALSPDKPLHNGDAQSGRETGQNQRRQAAETHIAGTVS